MPWACQIGDGDKKKQLRLEDLDIGVLEDFAAEQETDWVTVVFSPLQSLRTAKALVELCAGVLKVKPPKDLSTPRVLIDSFEQVVDDLPDNFDGDGLPLETPGDPPTE